MNNNSNSVRIQFLGQCGFLINYKDTNILIDAVLNELLDKNTGLTKRLYPYPFKANDIKVDYMLFSHEHRDHFAYETACDAYSNKDIKYIIPKGFVHRLDFLNKNNDNVVAMSGVDKVSFDEIEVESFPTFHPDKNIDNNLGYLITVGGKKIVHLGDTYLNDELFNTLKDIGEIDVLMAPVNGRDYFREARGVIGNMDNEEAAILAWTLNVKCFIPTHYDMMKGNTSDIRRSINKAEELGYKNLKVLKVTETIEI